MSLYEQIQEALTEITFPMMDSSLAMFQYEKRNKLQKSNSIRLCMCCEEEDQEDEYRLLLEEIEDLKDRKDEYEEKSEEGGE